MWRSVCFSVLLIHNKFHELVGILPFLYPRRWQEMVMMLSEIDDKTMRIAGLASMLLGTGLLYLIN